MYGSSTKEKNNGLTQGIIDLLNAKYATEVSKNPCVGLSRIDPVVKSEDYWIYFVKGSKGSAFYRVNGDAERTTIVKEIKDAITYTKNAVVDTYHEICAEMGFKK